MDAKLPSTSTMRPDFPVVVDCFCCHLTDARGDMRWYDTGERRGEELLAFDSRDFKTESVLKGKQKNETIGFSFFLSFFSTLASTTLFFFDAEEGERRTLLSQQEQRRRRRRRRREEKKKEQFLYFFSPFRVSCSSFLFSARKIEE